MYDSQDIKKLQPKNFFQNKLQPKFFFKTTCNQKFFFKTTCNPKIFFKTTCNPNFFFSKQLATKKLQPKIFFKTTCNQNFFKNNTILDAAINLEKAVPWTASSKLLCGCITDDNPLTVMLEYEHRNDGVKIFKSIAFLKKLF